MNPNYEKILLPPETSFICYHRVSECFPFCWHHHDEFELTLIIKGKGKRFIGDNITSNDDGDLVLIGPNIPHTWKSRPGQNNCEAIVIQFTPDLLDQQILQKPEFKNVRKLLQQSDHAIFFKGKSLQTAINKMIQLPATNGIAKILGLFELLDFLSANFKRISISGKAFKKAYTPQVESRIENIIRYIAENYTDRITLQQASKIAHMSPASFSRFFKRVTGKTFIEYVTELRISKACELLIDTDLRVSEICFTSGFQSLPNFNARFKKLKNLSPRMYRKEFSNR